MKREAKTTQVQRAQLLHATGMREEDHDTALSMEGRQLLRDVLTDLDTAEADVGRLRAALTRVDTMANYTMGLNSKSLLRCIAHLSFVAKRALWGEEIPEEIRGERGAEKQVMHAVLMSREQLNAMWEAARVYDDEYATPLPSPRRAVWCAALEALSHAVHEAS